MLRKIDNGTPLKRKRMPKSGGLRICQSFLSIIALVGDGPLKPEPTAAPDTHLTAVEAIPSTPIDKRHDLQIVRVRATTK
jgi:hypothetical protein